MNSKDILYSKGNNDECYTPIYAIFPLLKYIHKDKKIWFPFDKENSNFVKVFKENNYNITYSHIENNQNFFNYEPDEWDIIVSNPPFTNKRKFFERALSFNKPFALLMTNTWLNDSAPKQLFKDKDLQLLMFDKRIKFENNGIVENKITFSSSYYCYNLLPKQIIMEFLKYNLIL
jgi:hypothetical protein